MPTPIPRKPSAGSLSAQPSSVSNEDLNLPLNKASGTKRRAKKGSASKPIRKAAAPFKPAGPSLEQRKDSSPSKQDLQSHRFIRLAELEDLFQKAFWAVYPQLKSDAGAVLEQLKSVQEVLDRMDKLSPGAMRNRQSYSQELQTILKGLEGLGLKLQHSLDQARAKASAKDILFDVKLESFIDKLKTSIPTLEQLKAKGYSEINKPWQKPHA